MKELGITKGEEQKAKDFFNKAYSLCKWHISYLTHGWIAKLMVHFSREQNTELLERYNEAITALKKIEKYSVYPKQELIKDRFKRLRTISKKVLEKHEEQTISKAKP